MEYSIYYKTRYRAQGSWREDLACDVLISAHNSSERVRYVLDEFRAGRKVSLLQPEYAIADEDVPDGCFRCDSLDEADFVNEFIAWANIDFTAHRVIIDCTGFMRPHLMFMLRRLRSMGIAKVEVVYSEPVRYAARENTQFAAGTVLGVRSVRGFSGTHTIVSANDLLIIGAGYEHDLIGYVTDDRKSARRVRILPFPPLQPDFFQEAVLRGAQAEESVGRRDVYFAPANDPFAMADTLRNVVEVERLRRDVDNIYFAPLATKAQALGFAFYYIQEMLDAPASIIFPYSEKYHPETSVGFSGIWHYVFEF